MRLFILFYINKQGTTCHIPTTFTDAASCLNHGAELEANGVATDYDYTVIDAPQSLIDRHRKEEIKCHTRVKPHIPMTNVANDGNREPLRTSRAAVIRRLPISL